MPSPTREDSNRLALERLAYRMLGAWADAEDVAQESLIKWFRMDEADRERIEEPLAWLRTVATRLCLDRLKSARHRRESYVGPWLPEPILVDEASPAQSLVTEESVDMALMVALQKLSPAERAAFLLRDVFNYPFDQIAAILEKQPAACRKLASRARQTLTKERSRFEFDPKQHQALLTAFLEATRHGDAHALEQTLAADVAVYSDGGGIAPAAIKALHSADIVVRFFIGLRNKALKSDDLQEYRILLVNGLPGLIHIRNEALETVITASVSSNRIQAFYQQRNPEKLAQIARQLNLRVASYPRIKRNPTLRRAASGRHNLQ